MKTILSLHCWSSVEGWCWLEGDESVLFIPFVVRQEKVQCSCSGAPEGSGKFIKFLECLLVLLSKEDGDVLGFDVIRHLAVYVFSI